MDHPARGRCLLPTLEMAVPTAGHSTHMARWPAPAYLPDAFRRTGHTVVGPSVLADGPPEFSKRAVLFQGVGALGSEVLIHSRVPDGAVRHINLFGEVLKCPENAKRHEAWVPDAYCRDVNGLQGSPEDQAQPWPTTHVRHS